MTFRKYIYTSFFRLEKYVGVKIIYMCFLALIFGLKNIWRGESAEAANAFSRSAALLSWGIASWEASYYWLIGLLLLLGAFIGFDKSGCLMVAIGLLFAFANHYSPPSMEAMHSIMKEKKAELSSKGLELNSAFASIATPKNEDRSIRWEFALILGGTLLWGFGG